MRILIVDDEREVVAIFMHALQLIGDFDVEVAHNAEEALGHVIRRSFDLITLDISMPGTNGLEILALLRNLNPHAVIAILSGHIPDEISARFAACADLFIDKPVQVDLFQKMIEGALIASRTLEEIRLLGRQPALVN